MRHLQRLSAASLAGLLILACTPSQPPTPEPPQPPTPGAPAGTPSGPSPIAEPTPAAPTTPLVTSEPSPPTASPAPSPGSGAGWTYLPDFPVGEALAVNAVAAVGEGFVAVGYEPAPGEGPDGIRQGVVWTTSDGIEWQRSSDPAFAGASLDNVAALANDVYAFGYVSTCPAFDEDCPGLPDAGNAAWRRASDGSWSALSLPPSMRRAVIEGVSVALGALVVRGTIGDEEVDQALWLSPDGETWQEVANLGVDFVSEIAEASGAIVGLGTSYDFEADTISTEALYSADGRSFRKAEVPAGLQVAVDGLASGPAGLVAIGNAVPADPPDSGAMVLRSDDGQRWTAEQPPELAGHTAAAVLAMADGFVALATRSLTDAGEPFAGAAWWSVDGATWESLAPFSDAPFTEVTASAAGEPGIVIFAIMLSDERPMLHAWLGSPALIEAR